MFTSFGKNDLPKGYKIVTFLLVFLIGLEVFGFLKKPQKVTNLSYLDEVTIFQLNKPTEDTEPITSIPPFQKTNIFTEKYNKKYLQLAIESIVNEKNPYTHTSQYVVTDQEYNWLVRLVFLEAGYCSLETKISIISLVFNRLESGIWGDSLEEVLFYPNQFRKKKTLDKCIPYSLPKNPYYAQTKKFINAWDECFRAVDYVLEWGSILPSYVMFYRTDYHFKWKGYAKYTVLDNLYFGYVIAHKDKQEQG